VSLISKINTIKKHVSYALYNHYNYKTRNSRLQTFGYSASEVSLYLHP